MLRLAVIFAVGCTSFVQGPPKERTTVVNDCTDTYLLPAADIGLLAASVTFSAYVLKTEDGDDCSGMCPFLVAFGIANAIWMPIMIAHGFERVHACREYKEHRESVLVEEEERAKRGRAREHAWILTKQAAIAARAGNCDAVRETSAKVRAEDEDFHATVFVRDVAIARCL